jgi:hypothetical protein
VLFACQHLVGRVWTNVRMRYMGNSSLMAASATGNGKVPFGWSSSPTSREIVLGASSGSAS